MRDITITELRIDYRSRSRMYNALAREENQVSQRIEEPRVDEIEARLSREINRLERQVESTNVETSEVQAEMSNVVENELRSTMVNLNETHLNIVADAASSSTGGTGLLGIMLLGLGTGILLGGWVYHRNRREVESLESGFVENMVLRGIAKLKRNKYIAAGAAYLGLKWLRKIKK